jgi:S1-C subfamily serine protease
MHSSFLKKQLSFKGQLKCQLWNLAGNLLILLAIVSVSWLSGWSSPAQALPLQAIGATDSGSNFVTAAVNKAESAVVQVNISKNLGGDVSNAFRPFLGGPQGMAPGRVLRGLGSGFVIDPSGLILTNAHVVNDADSVTVTFQDGRILAGKVLGKDPVTDLAVLQVQAERLPIVTIGDSDKLQQGEWAIAIGNPLGLQETVTVGVISGTERSSLSIGVPDKRVGFIQTDAAINPGNSGGPLLNAKGEVIGVNTAIIQGTQGLGFAIPINTATQIAQQLIAKGYVEHPYIGVQMVALNPEVKEQINNNPNSDITVEKEQGVLVVQVGRGSPAAKAGLQAGDVIQEVNDKPVADARTIQKLLEQTGVGGELKLGLQRKGKTTTLSIQPEQLPVLQATR